MQLYEQIMNDKIDGIKQITKKNLKIFQEAAKILYETAKVLNTEKREKWFHANCQNISKDEYQKMGDI